ncbi:hypothetical protein N0V90_000341 [Kalmusia sp. IMI 367209]|nr:hypothetical protein N0V90_000341 [Kalmusia sp. IMI 367209]
MPGFISPLSASGTGTIAGMKRPYEVEAVPTYGQPHPKKRKVVHQLHHKQPLQHFVEPLGGGFGASDDQGFVNEQLRRAIAIQCKGVGFDSAKPEAVEAMTGLVHEFMTNFTDRIRKSMSSARRTEPLPHDYIYALTSNGLTGSSALEAHFDTGELPASMLQPAFAPPEPADPPPPDLEGMLGPELSGKADKESRRYIPTHFPPFPPKHTWKATPVYATRESDPHAIREKAAKEGIEAEKSLRKLMDAKKDGIRKRQAQRAQPKRSPLAINREMLWKEAMREALEEEDAEEEQRLRDAEQRADNDEADEDDAELIQAAAKDRREDRKRPTIEERLEQRVSVNYGRKFWRHAARDH